MAKVAKAKKAEGSSAATAGLASPSGGTGGAPTAAPANPKMSEAEVEVALKGVPEWSHVGEVIQRTYQFGDFVSAMRFVNAVALEAERVQHHPDVMIRYNKVTLSLATHDAGGITGKDFSLAAQADALSAVATKPG